MNNVKRKSAKKIAVVIGIVVLLNLLWFGWRLSETKPSGYKERRRLIMKKKYLGLLAFTLVFGLCACGISGTPDGSAPEEPPAASSNVTTIMEPVETDSGVMEPEKPAEADSNNTAVEGSDETESNNTAAEGSDGAGTEADMDLMGPWHLDSEKNDLTAFQDAFPAYAEFGASMEIKSNGQISWYIGAEGGAGTYMQDGGTLTADIVTDVDQKQITMPFRIISDGETVQLEMEYNGTAVYWIYGDSGETFK